MMRWQRLATCLGLIFVWLTFAAWQYQGFRHEHDLICQTLHQQSHSVMNALLGGIRSHRRLGRFFEEQLQALLDELVKSSDVLAAAVVSRQGERLLSAGKTSLFGSTVPVQLGAFWGPDGFQMAQKFRVAQEVPGLGPGAGAGRGRGPRWGQEGEDSAGILGNGGEFVALLLLDRTRTDQLAQRAARSHLLVSAGGAVVLICVALAWLASMRLVAAKGRAHLLETQTRHLRELGQAAAGLAHETRNPLGLIRGWAQRLAEFDAEDAERRAHTQAVIEECDRVTARINQFLAFARACEPSPEHVDVCGLIRELEMILQPDLEAKGIRLTCGGPGSGRRLVADRELLRQALFNMLLNAIQLAPQGDTVRVQVLAGKTCRIEVADRGPGVPAGAVDSLYTPYFTTRPHGTGLGLATVRRIAVAHGWETGYNPRPDGGSIFYIDGIHG